MKIGGFLPMLLGALVSSLAPVLFNRIFPDNSQQGQGILLPGTTGGYETGEGVHLPGDMPKRRRAHQVPDPSTYNDKAIIADNGMPGGLKIEGKMSYAPDSQMNLSTVNNPKAAGLKPKKKRHRALMAPAQVGMGYLDPMSEKFQMLQ
jgi:hypothetical protein